MADYRRGILSLATGIAKVSAHYGASVERVEKGTPGKFRNTAHMALRQHLIRHGRVCHVGHALAEAGHNALLLPNVVDGICKIVPDEGAEVAGMIAFPAG